MAVALLPATARAAAPSAVGQGFKVYTPRHNGKVERSHRKDNEYFYASHKFFSFEDYRKQLAVWQYEYNNFPMRPLNRRSPKQVLSAFPDV